MKFTEPVFFECFFNVAQVIRGVVGSQLLGAQLRYRPSVTATGTLPDLPGKSRFLTLLVVEKMSGPGTPANGAGVGSVKPLLI